jgi:hypothetical protein
MAIAIDGLRATRIDSEARAPLLLVALTMLTIALTFAVSALLLGQLHINYTEAGGSLLTKIHPATYLLTLTLAIRLALQPRRMRFLIAALTDHRGTVVFAWTVLSLLGYVALNLRVPFSSLIDTFIFPIMMILLLDGINERSARQLALLIHAVYAANAVLALIEMASGWHLTPLVALGIDLSRADHRSSAFFGHPLGNAMLTGLYITALVAGGGRDLPRWLRPVLILLQMAAMVSFGARLATVAMLGLISLLLLRAGWRILAGLRFHVTSAAAFLGLLPVAIVALGGAYAAGFFDQLLERFVSDNRSAEARVIMFELMARFPIFQLLFAPDQELLNAMMWTEGTEFGIESFWVSFILTYGLLPSLLFFLGLGAFLLDLRRHAGSGALWTIAFFLIVASGSLSIGAKTFALGALVIIDLTLLRADRAPPAALSWPLAGG